MIINNSGSDGIRFFNNGGGADVDNNLFQNLQIFESEEPLNWSLTFDIRKYKKEKLNAEKLTAILQVVHQNEVIQKDIHIKARGVSRKTGA